MVARSVDGSRIEARKQPMVGRCWPRGRAVWKDVLPRHPEGIG